MMKMMLMKMMRCCVAHTLADYMGNETGRHSLLVSGLPTIILFGSEVGVSKELYSEVILLDRLTGPVYEEKQ